MKKITQITVLIGSLLMLTMACSKTPAVTPLPTPPAATPAVTRLEKDGDISEISYNGDGTIHNILANRRGTTAPTDYVFSYENGKLKEINFDGKWKYTYTGNLLTLVQAYNNGGQLRFQYEFTYTNGSLTEKTEFLVSAAAGAAPKFKTKYYYGQDGNISKKEVFQFTNNAWMESEMILITEYDQYHNVTDALESFPYMPASSFSPNNPVRESYYDKGLVTQIVEHAYTYDANGRTVRKNQPKSMQDFLMLFRRSR
jgi:hypothetical protein